MGEESKNIIVNLNKKIARLISGYETQYTKNKQLDMEILRHKSKITYYETELKKYIAKQREFEDTISKMQLKETFLTTGGDAKEAKLKISNLIKEIDKCITLLND